MSSLTTGKRGRKRADLPAYAEVQPGVPDTRVRCRLCVKHASRTEYRGTWIQPLSLKAHEKLAVHLRSVTLENTETELLAERERCSQPQNFAVMNEINPIPHPDDPLSAQHNPHPSDAEQRMWDTWDGLTSLDPLNDNTIKDLEADFNQHLDNYEIWGVSEEATNMDMDSIGDRWNDEEEDTMISEILEQLETSDREHAEAVNDIPDGQWYPYPSKIPFLLDIIDNLPRIRISDTFMKVILWLLHEVGVKHIPSFYKLRQIQKLVADEKIVPTINRKSTKGNSFSLNDPRAIIANEWSNPLTAKNIHPYPVISRNGVISEIWHGQKWQNELDRHLMSPMFDAGNGRHFFIDEPAKLTNERIVIPIRWLSDEDGGLWFDAWEVKTDNQTGLSTIYDDSIVLLSTNQLKMNMLEIERDLILPKWCQNTINKGHAARMPNPDRAIADGYPLFTSFIDVFADDVSGNRSKSWNKHINIYITHRNLPRKILQQQSSIHFISCSTVASAPEQFEAVKSLIEDTHRQPVKAKMAVTGCEIRVKIVCNCGPGDNPAQSENCGHIGGAGNFPCRKCKVGGTTVEKETDEGFHKFFLPGEDRSSVDTLKEIDCQIQAACLGIAVRVQELQTKSGVKDMYIQSVLDGLIQRARSMRKANPGRSTEDIQQELLNWVSDRKAEILNPFLTLKGFDAARDTPVEILHTILLGIVKYGWYFSHSSWNDVQKQTFVLRLQATNTKGLSLQNHSIRASYIMQYANSLIGRQLKMLAQINPFHTYDLIDSLHFAFTKAVGELSALLWFPEIRNLTEYLSDVDIAAANVLDIAACIDPSKIILKIKYHLLTHLRQDIIRFGPLVGVATETFECFNAVFRYCSILSNHLAPSRDIACQLVQQEVLRHIFAGGSWLSNDGVTWNTPSPLITQSFTGNKSKFIHALMGCDSSSIKSDEHEIAGTIKLEAIKRFRNGIRNSSRPFFKLTGSKVLSAVNVPESLLRSSSSTNTWYRGKTVVASMSQDYCGIGSWVFATSPAIIGGPAGYHDQGEPTSTSHGQPQAHLSRPICGRIIEIFQRCNTSEGHILLDVFQVHEARHDIFGTPVLERQFDKELFVLVSPTAILFEFNVQHDCKYAKCTASGSRTVLQERVATGLTEAVIEHHLPERYLINTYNFHNAHLIRTILPRHLTIPIPYSTDRHTDHSVNAQLLRATKQARRLAAPLKKRKVAVTLPELGRLTNMEEIMIIESEDELAEGHSRESTNAIAESSQSGHNLRRAQFGAQASGQT